MIFSRHTGKIFRGAFAVAMALCLSAAFSGECPAQNSESYIAPPVSISRDKVRIDGKMYYSHVVLERQTLYSISKAYNISIDELYAANPSLKEEGLKKNSIIVIPIRDASAQTDAVVIIGPSVPEPEVSPLENVAATVSVPENSIIHTVKWFESFEDIADKYEVTVEDIMKANGLTSRKITTHQKLIIPALAVSSVTEAAREEEVYVLPDSLGFVRRNISVLMMLPLKLSQKPEGETNYMDFYCGALLAARDCALKGINIELQVVDVSDGVPVIDYSLFDAVIGPVSPSDIETVLELLPSDKMLISPMNPKVLPLASTHPNLIQAPTPSGTQVEDLVSWIKEDLKFGDNVMMIYEKSSIGEESGNDIPEEAEKLAGLLEEHGILFTTFSYNILEGRDIAETMEIEMQLISDTKVIIASESEAFVGDVVRNLSVMEHKGHKPVLYSQSKIKSFETIDAESLHKINLHICQSYEVDYNSADVQKFLLQYRALYNTEPGPFAFQGYDLTSYFTDMIASFGNGWTGHLQDRTTSGLQSDFKFSRIPDGGFVNSATQRLVYAPGYVITKIDRNAGSPE
ncbi:MAG: LysM peptidoglycan-binding domain-containing protein [Bacteroidales bacterium]|nr:LysM peptidoglycan-binding domain-containing protein [Bacteroidales bacterium]